MAEIVIRLDLHPENVDEADETGMTEEAYTAVSSALAAWGDLVDVSKVDMDEEEE